MIFFLSLPIASSSVPEPTIQIMSFLEKYSENKNIEIPGNLSANKKSKIGFLFLKILHLSIVLLYRAFKALRSCLLKQKITMIL